MPTYNGTSANDTLEGGDGDDIINGLAGNDTLYAGLGVDTLNGGDGDDQLVFNDFTGTRSGTFNGGTGTDTLFVSSEHVTYSQLTLSSIEKLWVNGTLWISSQQVSSLPSLIFSTSGTLQLTDAGAIDLINKAPYDYSVYASDFGNTIRTGSTWQTLNGGAGNDLFSAGDGNDALFGFGGNDTLNGEGGDDSLEGGAGDDTLNGGSGDDWIYYGTDSGNDVIDGGSGIDTLGADGDISGLNYKSMENLVSYSGNVTATIAQLLAFQQIFSSGFTLKDGGTIDFSPFINNPTTINASDFGNTITAGINNDSIYGGLGNDIINCGDGDDSVDAKDGDDTIYGGDGNDSLAGSGGSDTIYGGLGDDTLNGFGGSGHGSVLLGTYSEASDGYNILDGGDGNDSIVGGQNSLIVIGGNGDDYIFATGAIDGGEGNDHIDVIAYSLPTSVQAGAGNDTIDLTWVWYGQNVEVHAGTGNDAIRSGLGNCVLYGDDGDDSFQYAYGGGGIDTYIGGSGNDTYHLFSSLNQSISENSGEGRDKIFIDIGYVLPDNFEELEITGYGDLDLIGNAAANILTANDQNNLLDGLIGADTMIGNLGNDTYAVDDSGDIVIETIGGRGHGGVDLVLASISYRLTEYVDNLTLTGASNLDGFGNGLDNIISGNSGTNIIFAYEGNDSLSGGAGNDILNGGLGNDTLDGGNGFDVASYMDATSGLTAFLGASSLNSGSAAGDSFANIEGIIGSNFGDILWGTRYANSVDGAVGNDWLYGQDGADTILGGDGSDILSGGLGADSLDGGAGKDVAFYRDATASVYSVATNGVKADMIDGHTYGISLDTTSTINSFGEATGDTLTNIENIWGSNFDDIIRGSDSVGGQVYGFWGNDLLDGRGGNDVFYGGVGSDTIITGTGADDIYYKSYHDQRNAFGTLEPFEGGDTITDFEHGVDHVTVSRYWFGFGNIVGVAQSLTSQYADFITSGTTAISTKPTFFYDQATGQLMFDPDGTGKGAAVLMVTFSNNVNLTLSDIWTA